MPISEFRILSNLFQGSLPRTEQTWVTGYRFTLMCNTNYIAIKWKEKIKYKDSTTKTLATLAISQWVIHSTNFLLTNTKSLHFDWAH